MMFLNVCFSTCVEGSISTAMARMDTLDDEVQDVTRHPSTASNFDRRIISEASDLSIQDHQNKSCLTTSVHVQRCASVLGQDTNAIALLQGGQNSDERQSGKGRSWTTHCLQKRRTSHNTEKVTVVSDVSVGELVNSSTTSDGRGAPSHRS
ncbi:uncharacterized protein LOC122503362 [Leptopilina heterotoma]|uniref:uncharacterized protein LOC122503362 n=1 Tax=Leptopilina heterotoma TaxID=63436 RepID=UPI001CA87E5F|nr:uncharacterized protein LOC122503362 [Leptopilina heterotoma]